MRIAIEAVGVLAPGLRDWGSAQAVLAGSELFRDAPLAPLIQKTLYGGGAEGYTDYPALVVA